MVAGAGLRFDSAYIFSELAHSLPLLVHSTTTTSPDLDTNPRRALHILPSLRVRTTTSTTPRFLSCLNRPSSTLHPARGAYLAAIDDHVRLQARYVFYTIVNCEYEFCSWMAMTPATTSPHSHSSYATATSADWDTDTRLQMAARNASNSTRSQPVSPGSVMALIQNMSTRQPSP